MRKILNILIILGFSLLISFASSAQSYYYYYKGNKIFLELDTKSVNVFVKDTVALSNAGTIYVNNHNYPLQIEQGLVNSKFAKIELAENISISEYTNIIAELKQNSNINGIGVYFKKTNNSSVGTSNLFYVKLKNSNDYNLLQQFSIDKNVTIVRQIPNMPLWYILSTNNAHKLSIELASEYYESGLFQDVDPAFMFNFKSSCTNDPNFDVLWGLQNNEFPEYDINACNAWNISHGSNVVVAVVDHGIDKAHIDLSSNIHPLSFNTLTGASPSGNVNYHGTHVAGIVAAVKDNNWGVVGVAPNSKLMSISHPLLITTNVSAELASGISWAWQNGADIINNSWGDQGGFYYGNLHSITLESSIEDALNHGRNGKGAIVLFASGNHSVMDYPSYCNDDILTVGSINRRGEKVVSSGYGDKLDIVAPGDIIYSTYPNNSTAYLSGTSMACPHVSGVAALILSVNPDLTGKQVRDIIEKTAQKVRPDLYSYTQNPQRPNGAWNDEMGYGLVDAYAAVSMAKSLNTPADLFVRDSLSDFGDEPSKVTFMWNSPDIWLEDLDGNIVANPHGNTDYNLCVRVHNRRGKPSTGTEKLFTNWAKASPSLGWRDSWFGDSYFNCDNVNVPKGGFIGNTEGTIIPIIQPNSNTVVRVRWRTPRAEEYAACTDLANDLWHFCLLARVHDSYPIEGEDTDGSLGAFVVNNNNVAWKNVTFLESKNNSGVIGIYNPFKKSQKFSLVYSLRKNEEGELLHKYADVYLTLSRDFINLIDNGGISIEGLRRVDKNKFLVTSDKAYFNNISLNPSTLYTLQATVNFFTKETPVNNVFMFDIVQYCGSELIGGETYVAVRDPYRGSYFNAKANADKVVLAAEPVTFTAEDINENASYMWYNEQGDTIAIGTSLTTTPTQSQRYKLEVVADFDGFKDVDSVDVSVRNGFISAISPNPAVDNITVSYLLSSAATNATIRISDVQNLVIVSYPIIATETSKIVSVSNLNIGSYIVQLVVNGLVVDSKQLIVY